MLLVARRRGVVPLLFLACLSAPAASRVLRWAESPITTASRKNNWMSASAGTAHLWLNGLGRDCLRAGRFVHQRCERWDLVIPFDQGRPQSETAHGIPVEVPRGIGDAGRKIADVLARVPIDAKLLRKAMTLRGEARDGWFR